MMYSGDLSRENLSIITAFNYDKVFVVRGQHEMQHFQDNYLRFVRLRLRDYKVFGGENDFWFNRHRTLIVGKGGTGKTIIVQVLAYLGPPKMIRKHLMMKNRFIPSVAVVTEGNCDLLNKYRDLIFIDGDFIGVLATHIQKFKRKFMIADDTWKAVESEARSIFQGILSCKLRKIETNWDLNVHVMAAGEKICLGYAFAFALRKVLKLDVPAVLDSPYVRLDLELRAGMRNFLKAQPCQQILLGHECEFSDEEGPTYILVHTENYSHVMEF